MNGTVAPGSIGAALRAIPARAPFTDPALRAFAREGLVARIWPFAAVAVLGVGVVAIAPTDSPTLVAGGLLVAATIVMSWLVPWDRLPPALEIVPPLLFVLAVAFLRHADGGAASSLITLQALPIIWVALFGSRRQVAVIIAAEAVAIVTPGILIGGAAYPPDEWRHVAINLAIGALVGFTVQGLTRQIRGHVRDARGRASALETQEARLRAIHETAHDAIVTLRADGTIADVNPAALRLLGAAEHSALVGRALVEDFIVPEQRDPIRLALDELHTEPAGTSDHNFETMVMRLDGAPVPVDISVGVEGQGKGHLLHLFIRDASERAAVEAETRRHEADLEGLLDIAGRLSSPTEHRAVRTRICEAAAALTGATMVTLFEPAARDLVLTASAGRASPVDRVPLDSETSAAALVFATGEAYFSGDLASDPRVSRLLAEQARVSAGFWQPLRGAERLAGVLIVFWDQPIDAMDARTQSLLHLLASQASAALEMGRLVSRLEGLARTDGLTGIANRRTFDEVLATEVARAARAQVPLSLVMLDLDHFKAFNDARGHQAGDQLLIEAAAAWGRELRTADLLCRYGGEEFAVILPDCALPPGVRVADRLRRVTPGGQTTSAGVATWRDGESAADLVARADAALYQAKGEGRNRSVAA